MTRDTRKYVRQMIGIDDDKDKIISMKLMARLTRMEKALARVSRQSSIGREALAAIICGLTEDNWSEKSPEKIEADRAEAERIKQDKLDADRKAQEARMITEPV